MHPSLGLGICAREAAQPEPMEESIHKDHMELKRCIREVLVCCLEGLGARCELGKIHRCTEGS